MAENQALLTLALTIVGFIAGTACFIWWIHADDLDPRSIKRDNPGRRRSDR